jgi:hypothetical protein
MTEVQPRLAASPTPNTKDHDTIAPTTTTTTSSMPTLTPTPPPGRQGYRLIDGSKAYYRFSDIMFEASRRGQIIMTWLSWPQLTLQSRVHRSGTNNSLPTKPTRSNRYSISKPWSSLHILCNRIWAKNGGWCSISVSTYDFHLYAINTGYQLIASSTRFVLHCHRSHVSGRQAESVHDFQTGGIPRPLDPPDAARPQQRTYPYSQ